MRIQVPWANTKAKTCRGLPDVIEFLEKKHHDKMSYHENLGLRCTGLGQQEYLSLSIGLCRDKDALVLPILLYFCDMNTKSRFERQIDDRQ